jgi:U3 small nucleolar ribonucleoprotein component
LYKYKINSSYISFESFILNIRDYFNQNSNTIHKARNELKVITYQNDDVVVKSFKVPNILRRIYYTFFGETKAKRSYDYAIKIKEFTPDPIAYIEFYNNNLLSDSYFIAKKFDYDFTIREPLLDENFKNREEIFASFAEFTFNLHNNEIYHKDYSPGNILICKNKNGYLFKIVDINRMTFKELSLTERLNNFSKLWAKDKDLEIIIKRYAQLINMDEKKCLDRALSYSQKHKNKKNFKKRLKGEKVVD